MKKQDFERLVCGDKTPIFRHKDHGILVAGHGEYGGDNTRYIGLWPPIDWKASEPAPYFVLDPDIPRRILSDDDTWTGINVEDLEFTEKHYKETIDLTCVEDEFNFFL